MTYEKSPGGIFVPATPKPEEPKPELPEQCDECGAAWSSMPDEIFMTNVGFYSPEGHDHDGNCLTRPIICANGHKRIIGLRRSCPACDWRGKEQCCGSYRYVDAWPEVP